MTRIIALLFAVLLPLPALADMREAQDCAEKLSPSASDVFQGSLQAMRSGQDPQDAVDDEVKRLIANGNLKKEWARDVTSAAVQCMKLFQS